MKVLKVFAVLVLLLFGIHTATAQLANAYQIPLYFEDAAGHRDTLKLTFTTDGDIWSDNSSLGVINVADEPFDSTLEVRLTIRDITRSGWTEHQTRNPIITTGMNGGCFRNFVNFAILYSTDHYPVRMSWDSTQFGDDSPFWCWESPVFYNTIAPALIFDWVAAAEEIGATLLCLRNSSEGYWTRFDTPNGRDHPWTDPLIVDRLSGDSIVQDTVDFFFLESNFGPVSVNYCDPSVSTNEPTPPDRTTCDCGRLRENPVSGPLRFEGADVSWAGVYDLSGRLLAERKQPGGGAVGADLPTGTYLLRTYCPQSGFCVRKFVHR